MVDRPLPLPPPDFIDEDHNGLDDRVERTLALSFRIAEQVRALFAPPPARTVPERRDTLPELLERVQRAPGVVPGPPNPVITLHDGYEFRGVPLPTWARAAQVADDIAAGAWVAASEARDVRAYPAYGFAILEAAANAARAARRTLAEQVTRDVTHVAAAGHFGRQSGRWCSTFQPPTARHLELARLALYPRERPLLAGRARRWIDPLVQDHGKQAGKALAFNAIGIVEKWAAEGWAWIGPIAGPDGKAIIDPYRLTLFELCGATGTALALVPSTCAMIVDGRARWNVRPAIADPAPRTVA